MTARAGMERSATGVIGCAARNRWCLHRAMARRDRTGSVGTCARRQSRAGYRFSRRETPRGHALTTGLTWTESRLPGGPASTCRCRTAASRGQSGPAAAASETRPVPSSCRACCGALIDARRLSIYCLPYGRCRVGTGRRSGTHGVIQGSPGCELPCRMPAQTVSRHEGPAFGNVA